MNQTLEQRGRVETEAEQLCRGRSIGPPEKAFLMVRVPLSLNLTGMREKKKSPAISSMPTSPLSGLRITLYYIQHEEQKRRTWAGEASTLKKGKEKKRETGKTVFPLMTLMGRREFCFCFLALGVKVRMSVVLPFHVDASAHSLFFLIDAFGRCVSGEVTWRWDWSLSLKDHWRAAKGEKEVGGYLRKTLPRLWRK